MSSKNILVHTIAVVALAVGISFATLGATLAAFATSDDARHGARATHAYLAGLAGQQRELAA